MQQAQGMQNGTNIGETTNLIWFLFSHTKYFKGLANFFFFNLTILAVFHNEKLLQGTFQKKGT